MKIRFPLNIARYAKISFCLLILIFVLSAAATFHFNQGTITRSSLSLGKNLLETDCVITVPPFKERIYVSEQEAEAHLPYAVAALNAYRYPNNTSFKLENLTVDKILQYQLLDEGDNEGQHYVAYWKIGQPTQIILAFKGTTFSNFWDWFANFSWITGILPIKNRYDSAREIFHHVKDIAEKKFGSGNISYVVVGHSLGGGLAQHVATSYPCVDAVVFDTSPVTNVFMLKKPFRIGRVVHFHEDLDELTWFKKLLLGSYRDTLAFRDYPVNVKANTCPCSSKNSELCQGLQHSMEALAVGMARLVATCQLSTEKDGCQHNVSTDPAFRQLYCKSYASTEISKDPEACGN
jgi:hypothetical protein